MTNLQKLSLYKKIIVYSVVWVERPKLCWNQRLTTEINHLCAGPDTAESFAVPGVVWRWSTVTCALADAHFPSGLRGNLLAVRESSGLASTRRGCSHFHLDPPVAKAQYDHLSVVTWKQASCWQPVCVQVPHNQTMKPQGTRTGIHRPACRDQMEPGYRLCSRKELNKLK